LRKLLVLTTVLAVWLGGGTSTAQAHLVRVPDSPTKTFMENQLASQTENLKHAKYVCRHGKGQHRAWACWASSSVIRKNGQGWLRREYNKSYRIVHPPVLDIKTHIRTNHPCLADIIEGEPEYGSSGENGNYDPTLDYGHGHGNVYEAYGIPQANPGTKMSSAGADWATNPWTQLKWMIDYVNGRYGGECQAREYKRTYNVY
jgi:hypothetical protein